MITYRLTQRACDLGLPPEKTVTAACIHTDDDFVRFHDADHGLVYAVQRGLLLAMERVDDEDQAAVQEPDAVPVTHVVLEVDTSGFDEAVARAWRSVYRRNGGPSPFQR